MSAASVRRLSPLVRLLVLATVLLAAGPSSWMLGAELPGLAVDGLRFEAGSHSRMAWRISSMASFYGLYRGRILPEGTFFRLYNHRCLATEIGRASAEDPDRPLPGSAFYYLASGLRPGSSPSVMDWGPLDAPGAARPQGVLPCGRRIYVDRHAHGAGDGSSWTNAYTTVAKAVIHPSPPDRSLEIWMTDGAAENVSLGRGQIEFYGGFAGSEQYAWQRKPLALPFLWENRAGMPTPLVQGDGVWSSEEFAFVFDGIEFSGGSDGIFFLDSGLKLEVLRSVFHGQSQSALNLSTPSDYMFGLEFFLDQDELYAGGTNGALNIDIEGGDHGDWRIHRSLVRGEPIELMSFGVRDGLFGSEARIEMQANEIVGGDPAMRVVAQSWEANAALVDLALGGNLFHGQQGDAISISSEGGNGQARVRGLAAGNTLSDISGSGISCAVGVDTSGIATCVPRLQSNLFSFCANYAVQEDSDSGGGLRSDMELIGNDFFANGAILLDEGTTPLTTLAQVNTLPENWGNLDGDPLYVDRPAGDYHLQPGSKLIEACVLPAPGWSLIDLDHGPRTCEGDASPPALCDIGADEVRP